MTEPPMSHAEFKAALRTLERSVLWFSREAGTYPATVAGWFEPGGPGIPPKLAARLRRERDLALKAAREDPWPKPEEWRRDTRAGHPALRPRGGPNAAGAAGTPDPAAPSAPHPDERVSRKRPATESARPVKVPARR